MSGLLWLIPAMPFAGFVILALAGERLPGNRAAAVGVGSIGVSMIIALLTGMAFLTSPPPAHAYSQKLWMWMQVGAFRAPISFYLDALSLLMVVVITVVGFLIHLYSTEFMRGDEGYHRFFAYMNLFVGSMLTLVLADNLLLLYLGWEGVGLCSYLLIGFWYRNPDNGLAARKAFVVTRVGDTAFSIGLFLLFTNLGTLQIQELMQRAGAQWPVGSGLAIAAAALLLGGALGKSAQLPLQTWLPDAMAGPTPVSALIHAATMVTAGVYLIARTHVLFALAPPVQSAVAIIGVATLLLAGFSALVQRDIKRVLAYSTISQIGYMFLALGVGAWSAAMFHFMTHAFFKALLFLGAGAVILGLDDEHDIFRMGGLRTQLPLPFWTFLIGAASLSALPLVTAGFYSKDLILFKAWASKTGSPWLWAAGLAGALLTSLYTFRVVFIVFFGEAKSTVSRRPGTRMAVPLVVLAVLSLIGGFVELPRDLGNLPLFSEFLRTSFPSAPLTEGDLHTEVILQCISGLVALSGIFLAFFMFLRRRDYPDSLSSVRIASLLQRLWLKGWGFDWVYDRLVVRPFVRAARLNKDDFVDLVSLGVLWTSRTLTLTLSRSQTGKVRWYAMGIVIGAIVTLAMVALL
jgi:NADH-quinone oxidoreductase subunit L